MQLSTYLAPPLKPPRAANEAAPTRDPAPGRASAQEPRETQEPAHRPRAAAVVPFRPAASRRRPTGTHERRGEILFFLGVRYSRAS
jgi:hypothetical protein